MDLKIRKAQEETLLELYDKQCDSKEIIRHLESEIESFVAGDLT